MATAAAVTPLEAAREKHRDAIEALDDATSAIRRLFNELGPNHEERLEVSTIHREVGSLMARLAKVSVES